MHRTQYATYLFDLDGTLIDSTGLIMEAFRHAFRTTFGLEPSSDQERRWREGFGTPLRPQLGKFSKSDDQLNELVETYKSYTTMHHDRVIASYLGMNEVVHNLWQAGVKLAIVTSKTHLLARRGLERCKLNKYFDIVIGMDDVEKHKPDPAPVLEALTRLSAHPTSTVFIGDSPHDVIAGHRAGVDTAAVLWGAFAREVLEKESPRHVLSAPADILEMVP